jgi:hypothetical protein
LLKLTRIDLLPRFPHLPEIPFSSFLTVKNSRGWN